MGTGWAHLRLDLVAAATRGWLEQAERDVVHFLNCTIETPWLTRVFVTIQNYRLAVVLFLAASAALALRRPRRALRALLVTGAAFGISMAVATLMWDTIERQRPPHHYARHLTTPQEIATCAADPEALVLPVHAGRSPSFPSRHAMTVGVMVTALWLVAPWAGLLAALYGAVVVVGRIAVGKHWPSDMAVGLVLGALAAWLCWALVPRILGLVGARGWVEPRETP